MQHKYVPRKYAGNPIVCPKCGAIFDEPLCIPHPDEGWEEYVCPTCLSLWDGEEGQKCNLCGNWKHPNDMASAHCCKACAAAAEADENLFHQYLTAEGLEGEFFADFMLRYVDLIGFGKVKFRYTRKAERAALIRDFLSDDKQRFAEWLEAQA